VDVFAGFASGVVRMGLYKGNMHFLSLTECRASLYNEADSSMEASKGLNPQSSQGYAEIQSVEALTLAKAGQIRK
jgi:argininosuccinate synthase